MPIELEVCVQGITSALAAAEGGASRVELCEDLAVGGVTPSAGTIAVACARLPIPVHVLIRPRGGDFRYDVAEFAVMRRDIEIVRPLGAAGVVLGVLDRDGAVDRARMAELIAAACPLSVTVHKAFDAARDPFEALDVLIDLGVDRVLTSGGAPTARAGVETLSALVRRARGRIAILAGGQIALDDVPSLVAAGLGELHVGSAAGPPGQTDPARVRALVDCLRRSG